MFNHKINRLINLKLKTMKKSYLFLTAAVIGAFALTFFSTSCGDDEETKTIIDTITKTDTIKEYDYDVELEGNISADMSFDASKSYLLKGFVFVDDGVTLTIPAGTVIEAEAGQGENASALIVSQGGKIMAEGTSSNPIIFTGKGDGAEANFTKNVQGLWGGIIILGKATTNNTTNKKVEGVPDSYNAVYGGTADDDNSGTLSYVSIRHGGTDIGAGNEINGLTLGGVGSGTTIEYVEVISNVDDGVEFFGGAANIKNVLVALCGDDSYDYDEGYHGKAQYICAIQSSRTGDRCAEQDGGTGDDEEATPYATPVFANVSYFGNGGKLMIFRDNAGGHYHNAVFANTASGIRLETRTDKHDSYQQMQDESNLSINNCVFYMVADGDTADLMFAKREKGDEPAEADANAKAHWMANGNMIEDLALWDDEEEELTGYIPASGKAANGVAMTDSWFESNTYQGAFEPGGSNWADGWTLMFK